MCTQRYHTPAPSLQINTGPQSCGYRPTQRQEWELAGLALSLV